MSFQTWFAREKYVAMHAQSLRFRIVKYCILLTLALAIYVWSGWKAVVMTFMILLLLALAIHFFFRWKTKAWTESWGPYKKIDLPKDL